MGIPPEVCWSMEGNLILQLLNHTCKTYLVSPPGYATGHLDYHPAYLRFSGGRAIPGSYLILIIPLRSIPAKYI